MEIDGFVVQCSKVSPRLRTWPGKKNQGVAILSPVLLLAGYARQKQAAAISAAFIFVNSLSGFAGWLQQGKSLDPNLPWMLLLATSAGLAGAWLGARRYTPTTLKWVLAAVLLVAAGRLLVW